MLVWIISITDMFMQAGPEETFNLQRAGISLVLITIACLVSLLLPFTHDVNVLQRMITRLQRIELTRMILNKMIL